MFKYFLRCRAVAGPIVIMIAMLFVVGCSKKIAPVSGSAGLSNEAKASTSTRTPSSTTAKNGTPGKEGQANRGSDSEVRDREMAKQGSAEDGSPGRNSTGNHADERASSGSDSPDSGSRGTDSQGRPFGDSAFNSESGNQGPLFLENVYFDYDKAIVRIDAKEALEENSRWLALNAKIKVQIEGHGDERGTNDYNLALGERRARSIMRYLINLGISESRFSFISYGEEKNICSESKEDCYQKNRRVHFLVKR